VAVAVGSALQRALVMALKDALLTGTEEEVRQAASLVLSAEPEAA
jgi:hypothetical protein